MPHSDGREVRWGVWDRTGITFGLDVAEDVFETLTAAFQYVGEQLRDNGPSDEDIQYDIQLAVALKSGDGWVPLRDSNPISVDARYATYPDEDDDS